MDGGSGSTRSNGEAEGLFYRVPRDPGRYPDARHQDKDVVRAPMTLTTLPYSVDQLTWAFLDMTDAGGRLALMWDTQMAVVPFTIGKE